MLYGWTMLKYCFDHVCRQISQERMSLPLRIKLWIESWNSWRWGIFAWQSCEVQRCYYLSLHGRWKSILETTWSPPNLSDIASWLGQPLCLSNSLENVRGWPCEQLPYFSSFCLKYLYHILILNIFFFLQLNQFRDKQK